MELVGLVDVQLAGLVAAVLGRLCCFLRLHIFRMAEGEQRHLFLETTLICLRLLTPGSLLIVLMDSVLSM